MPYPDPAAAEAAFYAAFSALDLAGMTAVWANSPETSCIHPGGGLLRGTPTILASWAGIFTGSEPPQIRHRVLQASSDRRLAVHTVEEAVNSGAGKRRAVILATNVYIHAGDGWRLLAHHASLPLVDKGAGPHAAVALH